MKLYTNKNQYIAFTKKTKGFAIERELKIGGTTKAKMGIDSKLLKRAINHFRGVVEIRIKQKVRCPKALFITDGKKTAFIAEFLLARGLKQ